MTTQAARPDDRHEDPRAKFNALAPTYDDLQFLQRCGRRLAEVASIPAGARVLDVATGTGWVALAAARFTGPGGRVVGVDLAPDMLARARSKAEEAGLAQAEFREGDAVHLDFPDGSFDFVLCASSLFFFPDMAATVREWRRVLRPGGSLVFSSFGPSFLQPLRDLWTARMAEYDLTPAHLPTHRLADAATCAGLLRDAGLDGVGVREEQLGYHLKGAAERWADIVAGLEGKPVFTLTPEQREKAKADHFAELARLATPEGIWVDVPALFAFGRRSGA